MTATGNELGLKKVAQNPHALYREPVYRLLAARGEEGLCLPEIASALGFETWTVHAAVKYLYAHGRIGRRMEHYRLRVGNSMSSRQRRYRWFVCPGACPGSLLGDDEGVQQHGEWVSQHGRATERQVDHLPAGTVADESQPRLPYPPSGSQ